MQILITGGNGYIGGRLSIFLKNLGHKLIIGSRNITNRIENSHGSKLVYIQWDDRDNLRKCCSGIDIIVHLAGMNAQDCLKNPSKAMEFNCFATKKLFEASIKEGVKKFIYLSTSQVYGLSIEGKINEESPTPNKHPYALSNLAGENIVLDKFFQKKTEGIVLRVSNSFGAPANKYSNCWMLLTNDLCRQIFEKGYMELNSTGTQIRNFISMSNLCRVISFIINYESMSLPYKIFNVGGLWSPSVLEMAEFISGRYYLLFNKKVNIQKKEIQDHCYMKKNLNFDSTKLTDLGFMFQSDTSDEIDNLLRFCYNNYGSKDIE